MAVKWRADRPIEDPFPITKERVAAWGAAIAAVTVAVITAVRGFEIPLSENQRSVVVAASVVSCLSLGRGVYASALARLDVAQIRQTGRGDLLTDAVVCALGGISCAVLAIDTDPWFWPGCALFMATAVDQAQFVRKGRVS
ncbi:hypothetical protein [Terrabacter sp. MAHUQ-38]|uniref:hypothetical protein n=1 Tax=unclassified Terrabacter TaxID=2630222 RepID=UPI00165DDC0E|nr:hypothetical protein [Terrabacter sp. MAHUQ-38]MBC9819692.1 hypothetical protein [Terrabacter sp. MAHUQ-38]